MKLFNNQFDKSCIFLSSHLTIYLQTYFFCASSWGMNAWFLPTWMHRVWRNGSSSCVHGHIECHCCAATSLGEMTWDGAPPSPGRNIPGGESTMSWWMVEIGRTAIWTWFHGMINLSRGPWLSVIWNPLSSHLLHNTGYLLQLDLLLSVFGFCSWLESSCWSHIYSCGHQRRPFGNVTWWII